MEISRTQKGGSAMAEKRFHKNMNIGEAIKLHPEAARVIEKFFGKGCFTCPGIKMESLAFGAMMHNVNPDEIVRELNALLEREPAQP